MTTWPIPGRPITTRYGIRGSHWRACGWHTGADIAAPTGTPILAPEPGRIVHVNYGASFGGKQFVLRPAGGGEWFFAHCSWRRAPGQVAEGTHIGAVGTEGNSTGPHLHLEFHTSPGWSCGRMTDPAVRLSNPTPTPTPPPPAPEEEVIAFFAFTEDDGSTSFTCEANLAAGTWHRLPRDQALEGARMRILKENGVPFKNLGLIGDPRVMGVQLPTPGTKDYQD